MSERRRGNSPLRGKPFDDNGRINFETAISSPCHKHVMEFLGWLSADIEELHDVEAPRLAESYLRFKVAIGNPDKS